MITRIKYGKIGPKLFSEVFVINPKLAIYVEIHNDTGELIIMNAITEQIFMLEKCKNVKRAKYKAKQILKDLGINFNTEFRRK